MGLFSRKQAASFGKIIPPGQTTRLSQVGQAVYVEGQRPDVSEFYLSGYIAAGSPTPGAPQFDGFADQFVAELLDGASGGDSWALPGALFVAVDFFGSGAMQVPRFLELADGALAVMARAGVSGGVIPPFLFDRWQAAQ